MFQRTGRCGTPGGENFAGCLQAGEESAMPGRNELPRGRGLPGSPKAPDGISQPSDLDPSLHRGPSMEWRAAFLRLPVVFTTQTGGVVSLQRVALLSVDPIGAIARFRGGRPLKDEAC